MRVVASDDGRTIPTERIIAAITEKTAIAVLSHAYYVSGALADVRAIQAHCRSVGALLCVDAYQTTGIYPYDVREWDLDIVTGGSHKWLCGGPGCGWIYVKPSLLERFRPAVTGWMAHARPFAFEDAPIVYAPSMYRFGTRHADDSRLRRRRNRATRSFAPIGVPRIRAHNVRFTEKIAAMALERGLRVNTPLEPERAHRLDRHRLRRRRQRVCRELIARRVFVDYRPGCGIRVGPHFYTTDDEIDAFFRALDRSTVTSVTQAHP